MEVDGWVIMPQEYKIIHGIYMVFPRVITDFKLSFTILTHFLENETLFS